MSDFHPVHWFIFAETDYTEAAKILPVYGERHYGNAACHCHQAAEKLLKGCLAAASDADMPHTRDLL